MRQYDDDRRSPVERIVGQDLDEQTGKGKPLSSRASQTQLARLRPQLAVRRAQRAHRAAQRLVSDRA